ncbi:MAG TPA: glycosyltransferase family 2 protein [Candidatus Sulfotelmatobacter sp.]|jgi:glycosyltransferase involved in cell wall biosynthesis|nr:glycosyltransferase family 2 protein [Candidatus Sulfotelmatobacter sp.]
MHYFHWIAGTILALAWFSRIVDAAIGMPSVADISRPEWDLRPVAGAPRVSIIVPARNEEGDIEQSLTRLLQLDYDNYEVIAVNDRSTDRTGEIMERVAGDKSLFDSGSRESRFSQKTRETGHPVLRVIHHRELPGGWLGKTHAMWTATNQASGDWLLFTDADVLFKADSVRRALAYAEAEKADHVVLFPQMIMKRPGEYMMIAFFQTMFVFGHRPWKVADPKSRDHMGVGAFNLVRRSVYEAVGTYEALRMEVLDDMKLGKVVKNAGFRQRNVFGGDLISIRWANGAMGVVNNLTKNFFAVLSFQWPRTLISAFGLAFLNLMPFVGVWLAHGWERVPYAVALGSMFLIYLGMSWRSGVPAYYFLLHPVSTALFIYTLLRSMFHTLWNNGIVWRGTRYPLEELRKGMV